ncbi:hypothetical protein ACHAQF_004012 [Verticillium nonalfalfae]
MDITKFVVSGRDAALLYGDYATYQTQLGKKLLNCRKKLGIVTRNRGKFQKKDDVTAEQIAQNREYGLDLPTIFPASLLTPSPPRYMHLLLLTSERAWANAMSIKAAHSADTDGINSRTRKHIVSRLEKAARTAETLVELLTEDQAGAERDDKLEAKAYAALIRGAASFEKQAWDPSVKAYAVARIIYSALATAAKGDIYKDLLSETIDPSIRYAAYQAKTPRTVPVTTIARKAFPQSDAWLVQQLNGLNPNILKQETSDSAEKSSGSENAPKTLTWRSREVKIEDAAISLAWGQVQEAKADLSEQLAALSGSDPKTAAGAYDDILTATQDAVDATKEAIDELRGEGVAQSDPRMQSLQITRTAVNYEMISWRIGRNRVLTGEHDGAEENYQPLSRKKSRKETAEIRKRKVDPPSRKIAKLRELVALYEGILQSVQSVRELPGVAADESLAHQLDATTQYFGALKALTIARSHNIVGNPVNALALINHARDEAQAAAPALAKVPQPSAGSPRNIQPVAEDAEYLEDFLDGELQRQRALVHIFHLQKEAAKAQEADGRAPPLIERLHQYPVGGVDLTNIVEIPPQVAPVPVKPIFLDIAWNYIDYPREGGAAPESKPQEKAAAEDKTAPPAQKKGWFGFGR